MRKTLTYLRLLPSLFSLASYLAFALYHRHEPFLWPWYALMVVGFIWELISRRQKKNQ